MHRCCCWSILYSSILRYRADSLRSHVIVQEWLDFYSASFEYQPKWCNTALAWLPVSAQALCTPCNHAPCHFMQSHIRKVYLAVACHLNFWQNGRDLLSAAAVTRGWNGYRNKSQHRKLTLEKKILPPLQQGFEPATFRSRVRCSNHWAIPAPNIHRILLHYLVVTWLVPREIAGVSAHVRCAPYIYIIINT